jgi:serine/threonine-protein kinase
MALSPGTRLGHYDVTALIGEAGMGQVWQATDAQLGRQVALKLLLDAFAHDPDRLARFQREAQVLASLNHPNVGGIHGLAEGKDWSFRGHKRARCRDGQKK